MTQLPELQQREDDRGIAEFAGAILLIAVIALGIAVFAVALFSQQAAPVLPSVTFNVTYGDDGSVAIRHQGGDTIPKDQLRIYIDNGSAVLGNEALTKGGKEWTAWGIGDILVYAPPEPLPGASEVLMVYADRGGGEYLLHISEGWKEPIPVPTTKPTGTVTATVPLVANFTANVTEGDAPLAVRFTDQSTGNVTAWAWDFGDGNSSTEQNPTHTYMAPGIYTVTLTVTRAGASDTETKTNYIVVTSSSTTWHDTLLNTGEGKPGTLMPGGYLEFRVAGAYSKVTIGGTQHDLAIGDTVKLVIGTSGKGKIYIRESWISTFAYDDVTLFINGEESGTGKINEVDGIWIANYEDLISTLTLNVPPVNAWTEFTVGGTPIINRIDDNRQITLSNLMPRKDGQMNLDNSPGEEKIWFEGSISSYTLG